jgi:hypothetical protein
VSFNLETLSAPARTLVASNAGYVYASPSALYLAVDQIPEVDYGRGYYGGRPATSVIHRFRLAGVETSYAGTMTLDGHILNQFAMDEHEGVLRVASTSGWVPDPNVASALTTFGDRDGAWQRLGHIGRIAPTEDIRSVRFDGPRGYVVTFKKTDPLFSFDLSRPEAHRLEGELKIPGYSTYMHPLDRDHLLAVGFEAEDQGSFAYFSGIQIQMFHVGDLRAPRLLWKKVIGTRGSASEAPTNHLAFTYFAPRKLLALPITICEGGSGGRNGTELTFSGLMTFNVSIDKGISEHGRMPFVTDGGQGASCGQWWTDARSVVKRSIFMDDYIFGLSDTHLRAARLTAMDKPLQVVPLQR